MQWVQVATFEYCPFTPKNWPLNKIREATIQPDLTLGPVSWELVSWTDLVFKNPGSENRSWLLGAKVGRRAVFAGATQNFRGDRAVLFHDWWWNHYSVIYQNSKNGRVNFIACKLKNINVGEGGMNLGPSPSWLHDLSHS